MGTASDGEEDESPSTAKLTKGYEYLLGMKIWSLTFERAEQLRAQLAEKTKAVAELEETSPSTLWIRDLDSINEELDLRDEKMQAQISEEKRAMQKTKRSAKVGK